MSRMRAAAAGGARQRLVDHDGADLVGDRRQPPVSDRLAHERLEPRRGLQRHLDGLLELVEGERLGQERAHAALGQLEGIDRRRLAAHRHHHRRRLPELGQVDDGAGVSVGELEIDDHEIGVPAVDQALRVGDAAAGAHVGEASAQRLLQAAQGSGAARDGAIVETVAHLREDLGEIRTQLEQVKGRALEELTGLEERRPVDVDQALANVAAALTSRFPCVHIRVDGGAVRPVLVAGGAPTLHRILANLVVNACEGDGGRGARRVEVHAREAGDGRVADDGPGLPAHVLSTPPGQALSTKPVGTGFGIGLVDGLVRASGGSLSWRNNEGGGARVIVEIPTV